MKELNLTIPWPPTVNTYYRAINRGRFATQILSKKARQYKKDVLRSVQVNLGPLTGRLALTIYLHPPTKHKIDIDNRVKAVQDSLTAAGIWLDDSQIDELTVYRCDIIKGGKAVVKVKEI